LELAIALSKAESNQSITSESVAASTSRSASVEKSSVGKRRIATRDEESLFGAEEEADIIDWEYIAKLERRLKDTARKLNKSGKLCQDLEHHLKVAQEALGAKALNGTTLHSEKFMRHKGKKLTEDERRAVLHCLKLCRMEKNASKTVSTADPIARTATYLGLSTRTVRDAESNRNIQDLRGTHLRFSYIRLLASDLRQKVTELNLSGVAVTLNRLHKYVRETSVDCRFIPTPETIRRIMHSMGFRYDKSGKAKNFIDTPDIKIKRRKYIQLRRLEKFKDAIFVWLDESYCNQYHVNNKVCGYFITVWLFYYSDHVVFIIPLNFLNFLIDLVF